MTVFDELAETDGDEEFRAWLSKLIDAKQDIVAFVSSRWPGNFQGEFDGYLKGSFNLSVVVKFDAGPKAVIRFPKPGHTATCLREEKVRNEVQVLQFLSEKTTIPVPRVVSWGIGEESPQQLGPFITMEFVEGTSLANLLKQPTESEKDEVILANDIGDTKLDYVYEQLADYILQLSQLDFDSIGAVSKDPTSNTWIVKDRPLTYNMNELASVVSSYPIHTYPTSTFQSTKSYLHHLANDHRTHLGTQRNIASTPEDAKNRLIARHCIKALIPHYCFDNTGPFKLFCDDLQPSNMLADTSTWRITAVLDFEFTNSMPSQFSFDPPSWLLLLGPDMWLEHHSFDEFVARYTPRLEQFLATMRRVEDEKGLGVGERLSEKMQESWDTGRFWFDYGMRKSFDVDAVYWAALSGKDEEGGHGLGNEEVEWFVERKMEHLRAYDEECKKRFG